MMTYDFDAFLERMAKLDYLKIIAVADEECGRVESFSRRVPGAVERRKRGSLQYAAKIKGFLFYMRYGKRPQGVSDSDFQKYKVVVEALVRKKQYKPEVLNAFR